MKFIFIAPRFHTNFYYATKTLIDHNHQVDFFVLYKGVSEMHDLVNPKVLGYSKLFTWWNNWRNPGGGRVIKTQYELRCGFPPIFTFLNSLIKSKADVLIIKDIVTSYSLLALIFGFLLRKKMIVWNHIAKHRKKRKSGSVYWLWRIFGVYTITPILGDDRYENDNYNLIYMPFIIPAYEGSKNYFEFDNKITVLCVGKFQERKNQLLLLKAINNLKKDFSIRLLLVGQDDEIEYFSKIKNFINKNNLETTVEISNNVPWNKMPDFYKKSDIFVLPSYSEPASYSTLEAMSYGLPVLVSNEDGVQSYVKEGKNGFVFDPFDCEDLTKKLKIIFSNRDDLIKMGNFSKKLVKRVHDPDIFYNKLMNLIESYD